MASFENAIASLGAVANLTMVEDAERSAPRCPGLYSIYIDCANNLPEPFSEELKRRETCLLYVGIATKSLKQRLIKEDLRHRRPSTFFRGIGAILGYRPIPGSLRNRANKTNFKFCESDTAKIIQWIDNHLSVRWVECESASLRKFEKAVIRQLAPLMNTHHNPAKSEMLAALRRKCREVATS